MANKSMEANSLKASPPTDENAASHVAKNTAKTEMKLSDLRNVDLTAWKTQDLKGLLLKLKLKATGTKQERVERLGIFQENNELLETQLKEVHNNSVFHTSLVESEVAPLSSASSADRFLYPKVDSSTVATLVTRNKVVKGSLEKRTEFSCPAKFTL